LALRNQPSVNGMQQPWLRCWLGVLLSTTAGAQVPTVPAAQAHVRGRVVDAASRVPVGSAELLLMRATDTLARGRTDSLGRFTAAGTVGATFTLEIRRLGYEPAALQWTARADTLLIVGLTRAAATLSTVEVVEREPLSTRLAGFEERVRVKGGGTYIMRDQIEAWHPIHTSDLMRRVLGVKLIDSAGIMLASSDRGQKVDLKSARTAGSWAPCVMRVGVDGQIKEWGFPMDAIDPTHIHGIEVYNGPATIPSEYSGMRTDAYCGLVMIWTRMGEH
jgi:hypothetical protein